MRLLACDLKEHSELSHQHDELPHWLISTYILTLRQLILQQVLASLIVQNMACI